MDILKIEDGILELEYLISWHQDFKDIKIKNVNSF